MRRLVLLLPLSLLAACAEERAPIDRTQPNKLEKRFFVGDLEDRSDDPEFFLRTTVITADSGASSDGLFTNSDAQPVVRVRFELTEKRLIARLAYERVDGTDFQGWRPIEEGQVVAAFPIEGHFDVQREYNPSTGEETNVLVENDVDRPWNERAWMRVDWSKNEITTAYELDTLSQLGIYYGVKWEPVAWYASEPGSPDAPVFDELRGYFDVTQKALASPQVIHDEYWGDFPACWLTGSWPAVNCNPSEVTLRMAFLRVTDTDYEPLPYDGTEMDLFGMFTADRFGYDRRYGLTDDRWVRFAARWNLYVKSHGALACATEATTPKGASPQRDEDGDGTHDECAAVGAGARCDVFRQQCALPLRERQTRVIPWHVSPKFPEELFPGTAESLQSWSDAMRLAVLAGRVTECRRTGGASCEATHGWPDDFTGEYIPPLGDGPAQVPQIFVLCHNPVIEADDAACGVVGFSARPGDLRTHMVTYVNEPQEMSPWGIMMDAEDPLSGEKIAGSVTQWGSVLDRAASNVAELVGLMNGTLPQEEFLAGENIEAWVAEQRRGGSARERLALSAEEARKRKAAIDPSLEEKFAAASPRERRLPAKAERGRRAQALVDAGALGPGNGALAARLAKLRGTELEAQLASAEAAELLGLPPDAPISQEQLDRVSPFGLRSPLFRRSFEQARRRADARRHSCHREGPGPAHLTGLARELAALFPAPDPADAAAVLAHRDALWQEARKRLSQGVYSHELGHAMGLRHNFAASFDSFNYDVRYWQLRTDNGAVTQDCPEGNTDGASCVGPRWRDPLTEAEIDGNLGRHAFTSVMDYPGDENGDMNLPGSYDRAALRFVYGRSLDVWDEPGVSVTGSGAGQEKAFHLTGLAESPGLFGTYWFPPVDPEGDYTFLHYSRYHERFGMVRDCVDGDGPGGKVCKGPAMDVVHVDDMEEFSSDPTYAVFDWAVVPKAVDAQGRPRRGYLFSSDEYADTGNVPSFTDDAGADPYEQIRFLEDNYESKYLIDSFRHERVRFNSDDVTARVQGRYLDNMQQLAKTLAFALVLDGDPAQPREELLADGRYGPLALGTSVAFDLFARSMTRPEPGYYCEFCGPAQPVGANQTVYFADTAPLPELYLYDFRTDLGDGRYVHNEFDYSQGYFWGDYQTQVGSWYDKVWATYYLAEAFDSFVANSREDFTDGRYKNVNFATLYPRQVRRLYGALLTGDVAAYAPWVEVPVDPEETPDAKFLYPAWSEPDGPGPRPLTAKLADPAWSFNAQLYAMVWGTAFFSSNWSNGFVDDARVTVLGADQVGWSDAETRAFQDPVSGLTWRAHEVGTESYLGRTVPIGVGARMIDWANRLLAIAYVVDRDGFGRPVTLADGRLVPTLDADGRTQVRDPEAARALGRFVDQLAMFRQLTATFEQPLDAAELPWP